MCGLFVEQVAVEGQEHSAEKLERLLVECIEDWIVPVGEEGEQRRTSACLVLGAAQA
jgi:hypothetical protein